jgi:hypothetical protein
VILGRLIANALELAAANAHDRHADFIMKTSDNAPSAATAINVICNVSSGHAQDAISSAATLANAAAKR